MVSKKRYFITYGIHPTGECLSYQLNDHLKVGHTIPMKLPKLGDKSSKIIAARRKIIEKAVIETVVINRYNKTHLEKLKALRAKCIALNRAYEDDKLYLKEIKKY